MLTIFANVVDVHIDGGVNVDVDVDGGGGVVVGHGDDSQYDHNHANKRLCDSFVHSFCSSNKHKCSPLPSHSTTTIHLLMNAL